MGQCIKKNLKKRNNKHTNPHSHCAFWMKNQLTDSMLRLLWLVLFNTCQLHCHSESQASILEIISCLRDKSICYFMLMLHLGTYCKKCICVNAWTRHGFSAVCSCFILKVSFLVCLVYLCFLSFFVYSLFDILPCHNEFHLQVKHPRPLPLFMDYLLADFLDFFCIWIIACSLMDLFASPTA